MTPPTGIALMLPRITMLGRVEASAIETPLATGESGGGVVGVTAGGGGAGMVEVTAEGAGGDAFGPAGAAGTAGSLAVCRRAASNTISWNDIVMFRFLGSSASFSM